MTKTTEEQYIEAAVATALSRLDNQLADMMSKLCIMPMEAAEEAGILASRIRTSQGDDKQDPLFAANINELLAWALLFKCKHESALVALGQETMDQLGEEMASDRADLIAKANDPDTEGEPGA